MPAQDKVTREWDAMAGEWDDMAAGYRDEFVKLLWQETGYTEITARKYLVVVDFGCATGLLTEVIRSQVARVVALDVAPTMVQVVKDKIRSADWQNVEVHCAVVAHLTDPHVKAALEALQGKVDVVAASSVLSFVPEEDMEATIKALGGFLKPGTGILYHSDWVKGEQHPNGFDDPKALGMYQKGGLASKTTKTINMKMGAQEMPVFLGVATKNDS